MKKPLTALVAFVVTTVVSLGVVLVTFDINKHRDQIQSALSKETGRSVKLGGEIHVNISRKGLTLAIEDVSFGNPEWASQPDLAHIKSFDLKVALLPLLLKQVDISGMAIEDADIFLESASDNRHNWDMPITASKQANEVSKPKAGNDPILLKITSLSIKNSKITIRNQDGKTTIFTSDNATMGREGSNTALHFDGSLNTAAIRLTILTDLAPITSKAIRPVDVDVMFANYHIIAKGRIDVAGAKANFDHYALTAGDTTITGSLITAWGGNRPAVQGTIKSDHLNPDDLKMPSSGAQEKTQDPSNTKPQLYVFSNSPLAFDGLKSADMNFDVAIASMPAGSVEIQNIKSKLVINNGHLFLSPLTMALGAGVISGQVNLDTSNKPARLGTNFNVTDVDLSDIIQLGGIEAFLSGKVKADINLISSGNSMHELAGNLSGPINLISAGGDVLSTASDNISAGLAEILSPGTNTKKEGMNCLVARFIASNGVVKGNGILIDTVAATAAGYGDVDLRSETLNLDFHAKPKLVDVGSLLPPLHIGGTLSNPSPTLDAQSVVQNVGSMLMGGTPADGVPDVLTQQGQNACAYTLDHPSAAPASHAKGGVVQEMAGKAGSILKGLLGR